MMVIKFPSPYRGYHLSAMPEIDEYKVLMRFPSPYRGYHLSTIGNPLVVRREILLQFPSPYRGYHLSTRMIMGLDSYY